MLKGRRREGRENEFERPRGEEVERGADGTNVKGISVYSANMVVMMQATISLEAKWNESHDQLRCSPSLLCLRRPLNSQLSLIRRGHIDEDVLGLKSNFGVCG